MKFKKFRMRSFTTGNLLRCLSHLARYKPFSGYFRNFPFSGYPPLSSYTSIQELRGSRNLGFKLSSLWRVKDGDVLDQDFKFASQLPLKLTLFTWDSRLTNTVNAYEKMSVHIRLSGQASANFEMVVTLLSQPS